MKRLASLLLALLFIAAFAGMFGYGCGVTEASISGDCTACGLPARPLSPGDERAAIEEARAEVAQRFPTVSNVAAPRVEYRGCNFKIDGATTIPSDCYAGVTFSDRIVVSTQDVSRTAPLVTWEARNWFYIGVGHRELALGAST